MSEPKIGILRVLESAGTFQGFQRSFQACALPDLIMCTTVPLSLISFIEIQAQLFFQMTSLIAKSAWLP